jgi:hypothetical protein
MSRPLDIHIPAPVFDIPYHSSEAVTFGGLPSFRFVHHLEASAKDAVQERRFPRRLRPKHRQQVVVEAGIGQAPVSNGVAQSTCKALLLIHNLCFRTV